MQIQDTVAWRQRLGAYIVAAAALLLFGRLCLFVWKNAVNLLFWDQWDFYTPLFEGSSAWTIFRWQHGPHRQGIGFLLDSWLATYSRWDTRIESLAIAATMFAAMCAALLLKKRLFGSITFSDLAIPPLFLTLGHYEMLIGPSNPSHGSMPVLLLMLYCLAWTVRRPAGKYLLILLLNFLLIYTGFGLFAGIITIVLLAAECAFAARPHSKLRWPMTALVISLVSFGTFFIGYTHRPAVECFQFPHPDLLGYPWYAALILANFVHVQGVHLWPSVVGVLLLMLFVWPLLVHAVTSWRSALSDSLSLVIVVFSSFSLLFIATAAVGRVCLGMDTAIASRYVPYVIPGFLALYFHLLTLRPARWRGASLVVFCLVALYAGTGMTKLDRGGVYWLREGKAAWRACYLQREDVELCSKETGFPVSPHPEATRVRQKLDHLKANKLNLYGPE